MVKERKSFFKTFFRVATFIAALTFLGVNYDWTDIWNSVRGANLIWLLTAVLTSFLARVVAAFRWKLLYPSARVIELLGVTFIGRLYATILPGQLFGEAAKIAYVSARMKKRGAGTDIEQITASVVMDKLSGLLGLFIIGIIGASVSRGDNKSVLWALGVLIPIFILSAYTLGLPQIDSLLHKCHCFIESRSTILAHFILRIQDFLKIWRLYLRQRSRLGISVIMGSFFQMILAFSMYFTGMSIDLNVSPLDWFWIFAVLSVALLLPISIAGIGTREVSMAGALALVGVSVAVAVSCSLLMLGMQFIDSVIGIVVILATRKKKNTPYHT